MIKLLGVQILMKKMPFYAIYFLTLCTLSIPTYAVVRYADLERVGIGDPVITAIIVCMFPALLISIWWWNFQDKEDED